MPPAPPVRRAITTEDLRWGERCSRGLVLVVDDDCEILAAFRALLELEGYACETYGSALALLRTLDHPSPCFPGPCCILCDVMLPELNGLELQRSLAALTDTPMLLMSGVSGAAEVASAFRAGALDFLIKPIDAEVLLDAVARALAVSSDRQRQQARKGELARRFASLTRREREVARLVALGQRNQAVCDGLGISLRTVKRHRHQVMEKLAVSNLADLVRAMDEVDEPQSGNCSHKDTKTQRNTDH